MRKLMLVVAALFAANLFYQQTLYRSATTEVIVGTYAKTAMQACAERSQVLQLPTGKSAWERPASVKLVIGKRDLDVYLWQVSHSMWHARYKQPYLFITAGAAPNYILCEYDIFHRSASVQQM